MDDPKTLAEVVGVVGQKPRPRPCLRPTRPEKPLVEKPEKAFTVRAAFESARVPEMYRRYRLCELGYRTEPPCSGGILDWSSGGFFLGGINGQGKSTWAAAALRSRFDPNHSLSLAKIESRFIGQGRYENGVYHMPESRPFWVIPQGVARWWYSPDLVAWIQSSEIERHMNREFLIGELLRPEILVIDDFGKERWTDWVSEVMNTVFERRTAARKCLIVTSNMTIDQIDENRDLAIGSRLSGLVKVTLPARDRRAG